MKDKNSFQLYTEWIEVFEELSNKDAGELIKHIFQYVNDEDPITENPIVNIAFIQIKQQLKRDLKKWQHKRDVQRANGLLGGRPTGTKRTKRTQRTHGLKEEPKEPVEVKVEVEVKEKNKQKKLEFPFGSKAFLNSWRLWKDYKKNEHRFHYKSKVSEQAALSKIESLSKGREVDAIKILNESIANGWQGFFKLDNNNQPEIHRGKIERKYS